MHHCSILGVRTGCLSGLLALAAAGGGVVLGQAQQPDTNSSNGKAKAGAQAAPQARPARIAVSSEQSKQLRGPYGPYRANNDLLYYHLDVRVDPEKKTISGKNTIRFRMLQDDRRIQLDLAPALEIEKIQLGDTPLRYEREEGARSEE